MQSWQQNLCDVVDACAAHPPQVQGRLRGNGSNEAVRSALHRRVDDFFSSLAEHVASRSEQGFDALMPARPNAAGVLFANAALGQEVETDTASVTKALRG
jgi:hypothetical protein